jgi:putative SOS response-associated peptidase YedK
MCAHFEPSNSAALNKMLGRELLLVYNSNTFPGLQAPMIVQSESEGIEARLATFGLIPFWAKDRKFAKHTFNARSETVAEKPSFRAAWKARRFCLVPMQQFFEPCWETGKAVKWSIHRHDQQAFAVAGIWERWTDQESGEIVSSFSMLTINADGHPVMGRFHRPGDERRSLVVVAPSMWENWLLATPEQARAYLLPLDAREFTAAPLTQPT